MDKQIAEKIAAGKEAQKQKKPLQEPPYKTNFQINKYMHNYVARRGDHGDMSEEEEKLNPQGER